MAEQLSGAVPGDAARPMRPYATPHPEVVRAGSLRDALREAVGRAGYGFAVEPTSAPGWRHVAARAAVGGRGS
ncbi:MULTISPECIES: hypothetical protein [unclassified Streptomyces]|uniref:hypothetical protein n=1 Tax=unclassified Streptomyces TaxID=2593676 RepID=UPI0006AE00B2|nr:MULTISPECIES: hypothetical protein [unclassified Streptomyces]KOX34280.1 hypothetical protein ADL06_07820 [Streptomyces sp. NRRL F-6491]KOX42314.1 hypothetical protein ADL08_16580 [Streptomyces sp. NRRL F-6492]